MSSLQSWFKFSTAGLRSAFAAGPLDTVQSEVLSAPPIVADAPTIADVPPIDEKPIELEPVPETEDIHEAAVGEDRAPASIPGLRYREPRVLINWGRNVHLKILKMLAYVVFVAESIRNAVRLEARVAFLFPLVVEKITGEAGVTYQSVVEQTLAEQGALITAGKLLQRADRTDRYLELNDYWEQVDAAYAELVDSGDAELR